MTSASSLEPAGDATSTEPVSQTSASAGAPAALVPLTDSAATGAGVTLSEGTVTSPPAGATGGPSGAPGRPGVARRDSGSGRAARIRPLPDASLLPTLDAGFPWERSPLAGIPSTKILAELQRRRERASQLLAERARIVELMDAIESRLQLIGHDVEQLSMAAAGSASSKARRARSASPARAAGSPNKGKARKGKPATGDQRAGGAARSSARPAAGRAPRAENAVSLRDAIALAVEPRALVTPAEAAELVKRNGYRSTAANFGMVVANALAKDERFRRLGRGSYERIG